MVAGCGIVFFFLIKKAKAAYCENKGQVWEVVERKYLRKRNRVILLYTFALIIFYLFVFFWMKGKGISFPKEEKIFFLMYFLIFFPITFHIELNYRNMERWEIEEQNLSKLKGINYLLERRSIQKGRSFSFLFAFIIVVGIFLITEEDFLFTGPSNKTKVIDMQGTTIDSEMMWKNYLENYQPEIETEEKVVETEEILENNEHVSTIEQNTFDSTFKSDIYNKFVDYNSFLEFDGIIQTGDFNGDGNEDYLIKSPLANTSEAVYYIQFYGSERMLFLGAYEGGYLLSVECVDVDNNGSKELIVMGTNDHTYSVEDTSTFEIYQQNIWDDEIKWDKVRVPKGSRLMLQGADWDSDQLQRKSGFDYLLIYENNQYKLNLDGTEMSEYEIILPEGIITEDIQQLVNENVARPIYRYEVVEESSETFIRFYQNIGTAQHIIGEVVTTIVYHSKDGLTDYSVKKVEFLQK